MKWTRMITALTNFPVCSTAYFHHASNNVLTTNPQTTLRLMEFSPAWEGWILWSSNNMVGNSSLDHVTAMDYGITSLLFPSSWAEITWHLLVVC